MSKLAVPPNRRYYIKNWWTRAKNRPTICLINRQIISFFWKPRGMMEEGDGGWVSRGSYLVFATHFCRKEMPEQKRQPQHSRILFSALIFPRYYSLCFSPPKGKSAIMMGRINLAALFGITVTLLGSTAVGERVYFAVFAARYASVTPVICWLWCLFQTAVAGDICLFNFDAREKLWLCFVRPVLSLSLAERACLTETCAKGCVFV